MQDPTREEMLAFLAGDFQSDTLDAFDIEGAIYWFAANYHGGQGSNLYSTLSLSEFQPGPMCRGPQGFAEQLAYEALEQHFA